MNVHASSRPMVCALLALMVALGAPGRSRAAGAASASEGPPPSIDSAAVAPADSASQATAQGDSFPTPVPTPGANGLAQPADGVAPVPPGTPEPQVHHLSPAAALGVGLVASLAPPALALLMNPLSPHHSYYGLMDRGPQIAPEATLALGAAAGILIGPAIGLWSGGRGDLARRGLAWRGAGTLMTLAGLAGVGIALSEESRDAAVPAALIGVGALGTVVTGVSWLHDLAITPSATAQGIPVRVVVKAGRGGVVAIEVRF